MAGEQVAFRRAAVGAPVSEHSGLVDRSRVNRGGNGVGQISSANLTTSVADVAVTGDASINTKGAYSELIAATAVDSEMILLTVTLGTAISGSNRTCLVDLAFGAAASEVVKVPDLNFGHGRTQAAVLIPFAVPAGTRLSARCQGTQANQVINLTANVLQHGFAGPAPTSAVAYNIDATASWQTTVLTVVGGTNAKGTWTQLAAALSADARYMLVMMNGAGTTQQVGNALVDIGVGASSSEVAIISNLGFVANTTENIITSGIAAPFRVNLKAGDRISGRYQCDSTNTAARPNVTFITFN